MQASPAGSSPHAGRRLRVDVGLPQDGGLIPARGETTDSTRDRSDRAPAHPRTRGDDLFEPVVVARYSGSSPHAGRRPDGRVRRDPGRRLIPARGETSRQGSTRRPGPWAHPRTRGDDTSRPRTVTRFPGSSPHAGRRLELARGPACGDGLIPARGETTSAGRSGSSSRTAHPRTRGDDVMTPVTPSTAAGSSPHAGRRPVRRLRGADLVGLIPARGETTAAATPPAGASRAHPRTRGDDAVDGSTLTAQSGSSPHAGRRPPRRAARRDVGGLIPARGETTPAPRCSSAWPRAHPRTRGTDTRHGPTARSQRGSSPHAGRRLLRVVSRRPDLGLIPARGETTTSGRARLRSERAHPRTRGDDDRVRQSIDHEEGSSPHAGRRHGPCAVRDRRGGLIPARGETTTTSVSRGSLGTAHPRTRGDDYRDRATQERIFGSSPHAGRRRRGVDLPPVVPGLIPARGETTTGQAQRTGPRWAHPRTRGDDHAADSAAASSVGSSPHAGRRRADGALVVPPRGLIPARGETTPSQHYSTQFRPAHPRTRGDDMSLRGFVASAAGSSPHAGRRPGVGRGRLRAQGLIPARGETTSPLGVGRLPLRAHPRTRGDDGVGQGDFLGRRRLIPARGETTSSAPTGSR
ncbi:Domain of uncharacterised function (DUF2825) [Cellulomonas fimi]|nr:Domain of uncharacterised function (DUF2825) [Cellulomonas fimi]